MAERPGQEHGGPSIEARAEAERQAALRALERNEALAQRNDIGWIGRRRRRSDGTSTASSHSAREERLIASEARASRYAFAILVGFVLIVAWAVLL